MKLERLEFYNGPDGTVYIKPFNAPMFVYDLSCKHITQDMISRIRDLYPSAFNALAEIYTKSERNKEFFEYKIVHRFIRCNFGEYDALNYDVTANGTFQFEEVKCPLRGECIFEGLICKPKLQSKLSEREHEVAILLAQGLCRQQVADELGISINTVSRHITNIKQRMHIESMQQLISMFNDKE